MRKQQLRMAIGGAVAGGNNNVPGAAWVSNARSSGVTTTSNFVPTNGATCGESGLSSDCLAA